MSHEQRIIWLKAGSISVVAFGLLALLATIAATAGPMLFLVDLIFWPIDGTQSMASAETRLITGIAGGLMVGFGELLWLISTRVYAKDAGLGRRLILPGILGWFLVDSLGSILAGATLNAVFNTGFLAVFLIPLLWPKTAMPFEPTALEPDAS